MLKKFTPLFIVQFFAVINDNIFKNAMLVLVFYHDKKFFNFSSGQTANIANFLFILPFFLFSSWAGKIADSYSKVKITQYVKYAEIIIMGLVLYGLVYHHIAILMLALFLMGIHSTVFGPIKFSILPLYFKDTNQIFMANAWIELGSFVAILAGQIIGSWFMDDQHFNVIVYAIVFSSLIGLVFSFVMSPAQNAQSKHLKLYKNFLYDTYLTCKDVLKSAEIRENLNAISWFWAFGAVYTVQLPNFILHYLGGDNHVYTAVLALFCVGIGSGSVVCAKLSRGLIKIEFAFWGMMAVSILSLIMLILFHNNYAGKLLNLAEFIANIHGIIAALMFFVIGFCAGFYSVTCYNALPVIAPIEILSQVIAVNNILNAAFMVIAAIASMIILMFTNVIGLFVVLNICNIYFAYRYKTKFS